MVTYILIGTIDLKDNKVLDKVFKLDKTKTNIEMEVIL